MSRVVSVHSVQLLRTPQECGEHDPPMQEWLDLPLGPPCPHCGSDHWGTMNVHGYFPVRLCHDQHGVGCRTKFRSEPTLHMVHDIIEALLGKEQRFWHDHPNCGQETRETP